MAVDPLLTTRERGWGSPQEWLESRTGNIGESLNRGEWGYALGESIMLPFEAFNKAVGWTVGGPIQGTAAALQGQPLDWGWTPSMERYETINPLVRAGVEMGAGFALSPGLMVTKGFGTGVAPLLSRMEAGRAAARTAGELAKDPGAAGSIMKQIPGAPNLAERFLTSGPVEAVGNVGGAAVKVGLPVGAAWGGVTHDEPGEEPRSWFQRGVEGAVFGLAGAGAASAISLAVRKGRSLVVPVRPDKSELLPDFVGDPVWEARARDADAMSERDINPARAAAAGYEHPLSGIPSILHPGAGKRLWWTGFMLDNHDIDRLGFHFLDRFAEFRRWEEHVGRKKYQGKAAVETSPGVWTERPSGITGIGLESEEQAVEAMTQMLGSGRENQVLLRRLMSEFDKDDVKFDVRDARRLGAFDEWMNVKVVYDHLAEGLDLGEWIAADSAVVARALTRLQTTEERLRRQFGADIPDRFNRVMERMTQNHFNRQRMDEVSNEIITLDDATRIINSRSAYYYVIEPSHGKSHYAGLAEGEWVQPHGGPAMVSAEKGVGRVHSSDRNIYVSLNTLLEHYVARQRAIQRNVVGKRLEKWRDRDVDWANIMRPIHGDPDKVKPRVGYGTINVRKLDRTTVMGTTVDTISVQRYELPEDMANALMGMSTENADVTSRLMQFLSGPFKAGVTALSIPFLFRNIPRDFGDALLRKGVGSLTLQNYAAGVLDAITYGKVGQLLKEYSHLPFVRDFNLWDKYRKSLFVKDAAGKVVLGRDGQPLTYMDEMFLHGGGISTLAEVMGPTRSVAKMAGLPEGGIPIPNPFEFMRSGAEIGELATRVGVYRTARQAGKTADEAALMARETTVDFSRSGNLTRIFNMWLPLLNPRVQGIARDIRAMQEDPYGFFLRGWLLYGNPAIATYVHNREMYPDTTDKIPPEIRDSYFPIQIGEYTDRNQELRPLYFAVPKTSMARIATAPIEHLLETLTKIESYENTLPPDKRTERSTAKMVQDAIWSLSPINFDNGDFQDARNWPYRFLQGVVAANPIFGTTLQMAENKDWSRGGQPIEDPYRYNMPSDDTSEWADDITNPTLKLISDALGTNPVFQPSSSQLAFMARGFGGTMAQEFIGAADLIAERMGLVPPKTISYENLRIPDSDDPMLNKEINSQLARMDTRPWFVKWMPWWFGAAGGGQTQASKVQRISVKQQKVYQDNREAWAENEEYLSQSYYPGMREMDKKLVTGEDKMTHEGWINGFFDANKGKKSVLDSINQKHPLMIRNPKQREEFHNELPGIPVRFQYERISTGDLKDTRLAEAIRLWKAPPQLANRQDIMENPDNPGNKQVIDQVRYANLQRISREWGMEPKDIQDQILAALRGTKLPVVSIPAIWIEDAANRYRYPEGVEELGAFSADQISRLRNVELTKMAQEYNEMGYNITREQLRARIKARLSYPEERSDTVVSFERAMALSDEVSDDIKFPKFIHPITGEPMGDPRLWDSYEIQIALEKERRGTDYRKWSREVKLLDDARRAGELKRLEWLSLQPDYYTDYNRWFGVGRSMNQKQWEEYQAGRTTDGKEIKKYKTGTPEEWEAWDLAIRMYEAAPRSGPLRRQLASKVQRYNRLANPGWRAALMESQRQLEEQTGRAALESVLYKQARGDELSREEESLLENWIENPGMPLAPTGPTSPTVVDSTPRRTADELQRALGLR